MNNFTQCPRCGLTVAEGEGFNVQTWLKAHAKTCLPRTGTQPAEVVAVPVKRQGRKKVPPTSAPNAPSQVGELLNHMGETVAREFVKQLFKKGK